jgi:branched-chain amino acid transport system ATP-binding protein
VLSNLKPHKIAQKGIIRTFQADVLFRELTVLQNVLVGLHMKSVGLRPKQMLFSSTLIPPAETDRASDILETVGLAELREALAGDLPHGHQRLLGIAVSLAAEPKVLLMDEPVTGMNLNEIKAVTDLVGRLNEKGMTILLVEHNIKTVMAICQRVVVLNFGKKIAEGSPEEIRRNKDVIEAYLGPESA